MDHVGIKKLVLNINYYMRREAIEADWDGEGDPEMWCLLGMQAMAELVRKCRGDERKAKKYLELFS